MSRGAPEPPKVKRVEPVASGGKKRKMTKVNVRFIIHLVKTNCKKMLISMWVCLARVFKASDSADGLNLLDKPVDPGWWLR